LVIDLALLCVRLSVVHIFGGFFIFTVNILLDSVLVARKGRRSAQREALSNPLQYVRLWKIVTREFTAVSVLHTSLFNYLMRKDATVAEAETD
jgi:membrane associated rhomboid family serine protease